MSKFDAHDLRKAFDDGVNSERQRIIGLLRNKIITDYNNGDQHNQFKYYERLIEGKPAYWDIGEI